MSERTRLLARLALLAAVFSALDYLLVARWGPGKEYWRATGGGVRLFLVLSAGWSVMANGLVSERQSGGHRSPVGAVAMSLCLAGLIAVACLGDTATSGDEYAFLFQAKTYAAGRLWNPAPPGGQALAPMYTWVSGGIWVGQYPPGWPMVLAVTQLASLPPWVMNCALMGLVTVAIAAIVQRNGSDRQSAALAAALFCLSPFVLFNAASAFSHLLAAGLAAGVYLCRARADGEGRASFLLGAGALLGMLVLTRPPTAVVVALPLLPALVLPRMQWRQALLIGAGCLPFLLALFAYQAAVTDDPLEPVYHLGGRNVDHLYFDRRSIGIGLVLLLGKVKELSLWVSPLIVPLWAGLWIVKARRGALNAVDWVFPLAMVLFCFYPYDGGNRYGPRYYLDVWPLAICTIGGAVPSLTPGKAGMVRRAMVAAVVYGVTLTPFLAWQIATIVRERQEPFRLAAARNLANAIVCLEASAGRVSPMSPADLTRNGIVLDQPVLFANCTQIRPQALRAIFPGRTIWLYRGQPKLIPADR